MEKVNVSNYTSEPTTPATRCYIFCGQGITKVTAYGPEGDRYDTQDIGFAVWKNNVETQYTLTGGHYGAVGGSQTLDGKNDLIIFSSTAYAAYVGRFLLTYSG